MYIDKLDDIVDKYNNKYHRTIKMKPIDVKASTYIDFDIENNHKGPKLKVGDHVRIWKYKNIFAQDHTPNWSEEFFIFKKVRNSIPWAHVIHDLNREKFIATFHEKKYKRQIKPSLEKKNYKKGGKLYVKRKSYDDMIDSWVDKNSISIKDESYFSKLYNGYSRNVKVEIYLSNYVTKMI